METEDTFSSFFMLLLSGTGLIVILSLFFSGAIAYKTQAKTTAAKGGSNQYYNHVPSNDYGEDYTNEDDSNGTDQLYFELETSTDEASMMEK